MKLGVLSDTHGVLDPQLQSFFESCDEILHAGDIGSLAVMDTLKLWKPARFVYGNIDAYPIRRESEEILVRSYEDCKILMVHIAGPFGKYESKVRGWILNEKPQVLICGHSHLLKIRYDDRHRCLYLNPGAAGNQGFHKVRTAVRFDVAGDRVDNLQVIELQPRYLT